MNEGGAEVEYVGGVGVVTTIGASGGAGEGLGAGAGAGAAGGGGNGAVCATAEFRPMAVRTVHAAATPEAIRPGRGQKTNIFFIEGGL